MEHGTVVDPYLRQFCMYGTNAASDLASRNYNVVSLLEEQ